jgi:hypothetical protein
MTIREKLCEPIGKFYTETSKDLEKIADEYAIDFYNWCNSNEAEDLILDLILVGELEKKITPKELLEIFKKEKGL